MEMCERIQRLEGAIVILDRFFMRQRAALTNTSGKATICGDAKEDSLFLSNRQCS
jgi:hypothetical protein